MKIVILTPIIVEYNAVKKHLSNLRPEINTSNMTIYEVGDFLDHTIIIRLTGSGNFVLSNETEKCVNHFQPDIVLLVGVAGGIKDVAIGDIVVGTRAYDYESGKEHDLGMVSRDKGGFYNYELQEIARYESQSQDWLNRLEKPERAYQVIFGPIASGEKVVATNKGLIYNLIKQHCNDAIAVEMESVGFYTAMRPYPTIKAANIRAISDLLNNKEKADKAGSQELASSNVAAFTFELISKLQNYSSQQKKTNNMSEKNVVKGSVTDVKGDARIGNMNVPKDNNQYDKSNVIEGDVRNIGGNFTIGDTNIQNLTRKVIKNNQTVNNYGKVENQVNITENKAPINFNKDN